MFPLLCSYALICCKNIYHIAAFLNYKLIEKLKSDTENNLIHWQSFEGAYSEAEENGLHYTIKYKELFNKQNFPQYSNSILEGSEAKVPSPLALNPCT